LAILIHHAVPALAHPIIILIIAAHHLLTHIGIDVRGKSLFYRRWGLTLALPLSV